MGVGASTVKLAIESGADSQTTQVLLDSERQSLLNEALGKDSVPEIMTAGVRRDEAQEKARHLKTQALLKWSQRKPLSAEECAVCLEVVRQFLMSSTALMANHDAMTTLSNPAPAKVTKLGMLAYMGVCRMMNHIDPMSSVGAGLGVFYGGLIDRQRQPGVSRLSQQGFIVPHKMPVNIESNDAVVDTNNVLSLLNDELPGFELPFNLFNGRAFPNGNAGNSPARGRSSLRREARPVIPSQSLPNSNSLS